MIEHLSHSSVNLYLTCARAWKYRYVERVQTPTASALAFGSAFHEAVGQYIVGNATLEEGLRIPVHAIWLGKWADKMESQHDDIAWEENSPEDFKDLALRMLVGELEVTGGGPKRKVRNASVLLNDFKPLIENGAPAVEKYVQFTVPGVPIPIVGYIDLILEDGTPVDFKTAAKAWYAAKAHAELQPAFYLAALSQNGYFVPDNKFLYVVFTKTKTPKVQIVETKRTPAQLFWLADTIRDVWESVERGAFPPSGVGSWKCCAKYCGFWNICMGEG
jgi:CRISPR/Cas system-associated exonuclease Cas4 (RecB family)